MGSNNTGKFKKNNKPWNKDKSGYKIKYPKKRKLKHTLKSSHIENIKKSVPKGKFHYSWKGDQVGYAALHQWVEKKLGKPSACDKCDSANSKKYEWANKSGLYKRLKSDWIRLCTKCHRAFDKANQLEIQAEKL